MPRWAIVFEPGLAMDVSRVMGLVVETEAYRRSVLKIPLPPKMRRKFNNLNILRHIRGTTGIEGNSLGEEAIRAVLEARVPAPTTPGAPAPAVVSAPSTPCIEETEVLNASRALDFIRETLKREPHQAVTEDLVRTLHRINTEGCDYPGNIPGRYRQHEVEVGDYYPPDHREIPNLMRRFAEFVNLRAVVEGCGPLIRAVLAHFYLLSIHPFGDGNGRTSRALEAFMLYQGGYNVRGFYSLANYYYKHRGEYFRALQAARFDRQGDPSDFVRFSLEGFVEELAAMQDEILGYIRRVIFRDVYLQDEKDGRINARGASLVEYLTFDAPDGIPADAFRSRAHHISKGLYSGLKSQRTLLRDLAALQKQGLVVERRGVLVANLDLLSQESP